MADNIAQSKRTLNEAELARLAQSTGDVSNESFVVAALLARQLQGDLNTFKQQTVDNNGIKFNDIDMSKVMPSNIMKSMGRPVPPQSIPTQPVLQQPVPQPVMQPDFQFAAPPVQQVQAFVQPPSDPNQLEFDLNKQTRYEDIINAIDKLENKVNILTDKVNQLIDSNNKKKPKITNGT